MVAAYLRIADELRTAMLDGTLAPKARLPSRSELAATYGVSDKIAARAVQLLAAEGLVVTRPGSGAFVRERPPVRRFTRGHYGQRGQGSPFRVGEQTRGRRGDWEAHSASIRAAGPIADRLGIDAGDAVMRTEYVFRANGIPVMLSTSYEPLAITGRPDGAGRTPILLPEEGPYAGAGVVDRMGAIGVHVLEALEVTTTRPATAAEAEALGGISGGQVLHIVRTYFDTEHRAVETADIVLPGDRSEVESRYVIPE